MEVFEKVLPPYCEFTFPSAPTPSKYSSKRSSVIRSTFHDQLSYDFRTPLLNIPLNSIPKLWLIKYGIQS